MSSRNLRLFPCTLSFKAITEKMREEKMYVIVPRHIKLCVHVSGMTFNRATTETSRYNGA